MKLRLLLLGRKVMTNLDSILKKQRYHFANKGPSSQSYGFSSSCVWMWDLDYKENWVLKNWCFWTVVLEKTLESPLDCKEIKPVYPKGNQSWIFIGRIDGEAETPILWPPDAKNRLIRKYPDAGKDWRQEEKRMTEDEMVGWHYQLNGHEFEQSLGGGDEQGSLVCCSPWGCNELDTTEQLNWTEFQWSSLKYQTILFDYFYFVCTSLFLNKRGNVPLFSLYPMLFSTLQLMFKVTFNFSEETKQHSVIFNNSSILTFLCPFCPWVKTCRKSSCGWSLHASLWEGYIFRVGWVLSFLFFSFRSPW